MEEQRTDAFATDNEFSDTSKSVEQIKVEALGEIARERGRYSTEQKATEPENPFAENERFRTSIDVI